MDAGALALELVEVDDGAAEAGRVDDGVADVDDFAGCVESA
jgi:hypothetical protein